MHFLWPLERDKEQEQTFHTSDTPGNSYFLLPHCTCLNFTRSLSSVLQHVSCRLLLFAFVFDPQFDLDVEIKPMSRSLNLIHRNYKYFRTYSGQIGNVIANVSLF